MTITTRFLRRNDACEPQVKLFKKTFPGGKADVTKENYKIATKAGLDFSWLCYCLETKQWMEFDEKRCKAYQALNKRLNKISLEWEQGNMNERMDREEKRYTVKVEKILFDILASL